MVSDVVNRTNVIYWVIEIFDVRLFLIGQDGCKTVVDWPDWASIVMDHGELDELLHLLKTIVIIVIFLSYYCDIYVGKAVYLLIIVVVN